ncbi:MAG: hypothetical protein FVQ79_00415 [Planctomycetes bacterium]|nr:hypothetical protein [Planctomycetota bacterium]
MSKFFSFANLLFRKKKQQPIFPLSTAAIGVPNATQIFRTSIGLNIQQQQTPFGTIRYAVQSGLNIVTPQSHAILSGLRQQAVSQHKQAMSRAFYFGAGTQLGFSGQSSALGVSAGTQLGFSGVTAQGWKQTVKNLYPQGQTPLGAMMSNMSGGIDDPVFKFWDKGDPMNDPDYYTEDEIEPPDVTDYTEVKF